MQDFHQIFYYVILIVTFGKVLLRKVYYNEWRGKWRDTTRWRDWQLLDWMSEIH